MPKRVDHAARRLRITNAVLRLAGTGGIEGVSLRRVAAEAGVSMGMVQYYFATKDEMLTAACQELIQYAHEAVAAEEASADGEITARESLRRIMKLIIPLTEDRRAGTRIWIAFLARATVEPTLAKFMRQTWVESHARISGIMANALERGEIALNTDLDRESAAALALADGLVSHVLFGHYSPEEAIDAIDAFLERLFQA